MSEIILDGVLIDEDTGEILGEVPGKDRAAWAASRFAHFKSQIKAYEKAAAVVQQVLFRYQDGKAATYGDIKVSIRSSKRHDQDIPAIREWITECEMTRADLEAFALAAKGFDVSLLPVPLADFVKKNTAESMTRPFAIVETVLKPAPGVGKPGHVAS